ncbi:MAG: O-methyltransferase [Armatimonadota bacterium]|nr:O-methyltransferase [Armatimonadota bacterium]
MDNEKTPARLDAFISGLFAPEDDALTTALEDMKREGLPSINVSASEGKTLHVLARAIGAKRILEVGTLGGYSTIWLARALPEGGRLISLELDAHHADVARQNIARAGLTDKVEIRVGPASTSLAQMTAEEPFDLAFIDADKDGYVGYLEQVVPLVRPGGLILGDNTLSHSAMDPTADTGITRYNAAVAARADLASVIIPTLRHDIDGLLVSVKVG